MALVRFNEQLGKLNRVGIDIVAALPGVAGWQALNLAGLTEDRIERVVSRLPDDAFPLDTISAELNRVFASVHMSELVSSTPAIPPGRAWSSNEERVSRNPRPHHRWGQSRPTFAAERTQNHSASSAQWDTFEEVVDTEDEDSDTLILAICKKTYEMNSRYWPPTWTIAKMMLRFQVWTIPSWKQYI